MSPSLCTQGEEGRDKREFSKKVGRSDHVTRCICKKTGKIEDEKVSGGNLNSWYYAM